MTPERWRKVKELMGSALELPADERGDFLVSACREDQSLKDEVLSLLRHSQGEEDFLEEPALIDAATLLQRATTSDERLKRLVGTLLDGQYEIEALIGRGGMGAVFRARHRLLKRTVAIKIIDPAIGADAVYRHLFLREGRASMRLEHPHIVKVYDLREIADGTVYMVQEYLEGEPLSALLRRRARIPAAEAIALMTPIAEALDAAHASGVIHRDLKPGNILVGNENGEVTVKLLDLGIAKIVDARAGTVSVTVRGAVLGSPHYMSPEQWSGLANVDGRADLYSLAVIFYEMIAGRRPFEGPTLTSLAYQHATVAPPPLSKFVPELPAAFARAIERALSKQRARRQRHCRELIDQLKQALEQAPMQARRRTAAVAGVSLIALSALAGTLSFKAFTAAPQAPEKGRMAASLPALKAAAPAPVTETPPIDLGAISYKSNEHAFIPPPPPPPVDSLAARWLGKGQATFARGYPGIGKVVWKVDLELDFTVNEQNQITGEARLLYNAELVSGQARMEAENGPQQRRYPIAGELVGDQAFINITTDLGENLNIKFRAEPSGETPRLILKGFSQLPINPFECGAQLVKGRRGKLQLKSTYDYDGMKVEWSAARAL